MCVLSTCLLICMCPPRRTIIILCLTALMDYTGIVDQEITFRAGESMQCVSITILDDRNVLEEMVESFRVMLTAPEPFVFIPPEQESIVINIFEDPLDG